MASPGKEAMKRLRALSECCVCLTTYTDPRMLPCFHTACLKCIEDIQLKTGKKPGDGLPCPLCRNEFLIPADGMKGLQRNFFIESLMEVTNAFNLENKSRPCELCSADEEVKDVTEATMRCFNCCENYCPRCSKIHKTLKATKDHNIVELNIDINEEEIRNMSPIRKCVKHSDRVLDFYCSDCKTVVCVSCFVENHKTHECKDVTTVDKEFRRRIEHSFTEMKDSKEKMLSSKCELETRKRDLLEKVLETESAIRKKNQQLKAVIDQHTEELLYELSLLKQQREKKLDAEIEEIERKLTVQESFVTYCTELKSKGSPSEVCGSVDSLIARANELKKENKDDLKKPIKSFEFEFIATDHSASLGNASNFIGQLSGDLVEQRVDAIVNPANCDLRHGGGAARAISKAAGHALENEDESYTQNHGKQHLRNSLSASIESYKVAEKIKPLNFSSNNGSSENMNANNNNPHSNSASKEDNMCIICMDEITDVKELPCKHRFCRECINNCFEKHQLKCPSCGKVFGVLKGNQPPGTMNFRENYYQHLPGYSNCGTIEIQYSFQSGKQNENHPNSGQSYKGSTRTAYLPANKEGREVLGLLRRAFDSKLLFTIGRSDTTGNENVVILNDVHHKTSIYGQYGYPDATYLKRVKEELAAKGIQ